MPRWFSIALVIRQTKISYSELVGNLNLFSEAWRMPGAMSAPSLEDAAGLARMGREAARQATMIGYIDGFLLFTITATMVIPLIALVRPAPKS